MSIHPPRLVRPDPRQVLADNMRRLRAERGWSQEELSFRSGLDRSFLAHVERCARNASLDSIERIAAAFELPIAALFDEDASRPSGS
ncbi:helix-turn-helix domain-containing protein (plasmid) [Ralstonia sp. 25C]|uniref:helix-turn-helix domain-containing protein n=1 Tax=Ralstonia sp. 25C TaxID=3447363 RepID=UPI003F751CAC